MHLENVYFTGCWSAVVVLGWSHGWSAVLGYSPFLLYRCHHQAGKVSHTLHARLRRRCSLQYHQPVTLKTAMFDRIKGKVADVAGKHFDIHIQGSSKSWAPRGKKWHSIILVQQNMFRYICYETRCTYTHLLDQFNRVMKSNVTFRRART